MAERYDVAIVGGGLGGAATAARLAAGGARAILFEREATERPKVCGEFLSSVALAELVGLGLPAPSLGAIGLTTFRIAARKGATTIALPFEAASLTRERLDAALLGFAEDAGATVRRGVTIRALAPDGKPAVAPALSGDREGSSARTVPGGYVITPTAGAPVEADRIVVATGKSDLPTRRRGVGVHEGLVGLKLYAAPSAAGAAALGDAVEIILFPGGYCGVQKVEDGRLNVCLVVAAMRLKSLGGPRAVFAAMIDGSMRARELLGDARLDGKPLAIGRTPYGYVRRTTDGPYHVGDQAAVIPSFCGEGMALALVSARLAADAILANQSAIVAAERFASLAAGRVRAAAMLSRLLVRSEMQPLAVLAARTLPAATRWVASAVRTPV